ncbi:hypothetical protein K440DRAFT_664435 [Wilcoxina mikolae CBS 423.85]|nr:hypothetical protein K440DRAFT_664435 [Wilcoxina mikolae CBS 423.85]
MNLARHHPSTRRPLEPPTPTTSLAMNNHHHHPPPPRFITCVQSLQQYQHQLIFTAGILLAWFLLSELLRAIIRAAHRNAPRPPVEEYTDDDNHDDNYDAEESDYSVSSPEFTPDPPDHIKSPEFTPDPPDHIKSPSPDIVKKERLSPFTPPRTPLRQRLTSIPLPPPRFPNSPYIRNTSPSPPSPLQPGTLVLRPGTHDGPFIVLSTSNPAPAHLAHLPGAALAAWAELELPKGSRAERWYKEDKLVGYKGEITGKMVREWMRPREDGRHVMGTIRGERWKGGRREFRVGWRGWAAEDDTWEAAGKVRRVDKRLVREWEEGKKGGM